MSFEGSSVSLCPRKGQSVEVAVFLGIKISRQVDASFRGTAIVNFYHHKAGLFSGGRLLPLAFLRALTSCTLA